MKMKKFNLIETLNAYGFSSATSITGCPLFTLDLSQQIEVAFYGVQEQTLRIQVVFNSEKTTCTVNYYNGSLKPFKSKVHLADKRAWNAICETIRNKGFEMVIA